MSRYNLSILLIAMLILVCASTCLAVFPVPDGYQSVQMHRGWYNSNAAWYIMTDTSDLNFSIKNNLTLATKLESLIGAGASFVYLFTNSTQDPVFLRAPGDANYSGIWVVNFVTWLPGQFRFMTNTDPYNAVTNPTGFPTVAQATVVLSDIVVDAPILATGQLDGPWASTPGRYRIKQGKALSNYAYTKQVKLPFWLAYAQNDLTKDISLKRVLITDSGALDVATLLGANYAPQLNIADLANTQNFWPVNSPKPPSQYPVISDAPTWFNYKNTDQGYSPVQIYQIVAKSGIPFGTIVNNADYLLYLLGTGGLVPVGPSRIINAPVVPGNIYIL
ncbi:MAG: DUF7482 domain-containing protein [Armatimonadota bacterium]